MTLSLDEAIESAKLSAGPDRIIQQQYYEELLQKLPDESRYPFTMALAELNIGPRTGRREAAEAVARFLSSDAVSDVMSQGTGMSNRDLENKLVHAAMHRDAAWWDTIKDKFTNWWEDGPADEYEEEFGEPFPVRDRGTEDLYDTTPEDTITQYDFSGDAPLPSPPVGPPPAPPGPPAGVPYAPETPVPSEVDAPAFGGAGAIPEMTPVDSSNLESVGFNDEDGILYIIFKAKRNTPRTMYRYMDSDRSDYEGLTNPNVSAGKYFYQNIRNVKRYSGPEDPAAYGI